MTDAERKPLDQAVTEIMKQVAEEPLSNGKIRFCSAGNEIWETSPTASCETTQTSAVKHGWPTALTSSSETFGWIAYSRFLSEYCRATTDDENCAKLGLGRVSPLKLENLDGASLQPRNHFRNQFRKFFGFVISTAIPAAHADVAELPEPATNVQLEVCKVQNGEMISKTGSKIFFEFGPQPSESHSRLLTQTAVLAADKSHDEVAVNDGLTKLTSMGKPLLVSFNSKAPWVKERLSKDNVTWIGVEKTEAELGDKTGQKFAAGFDQLKSQLKSRRAISAKVQDAMTAGICPGASPCAWLQNDKIRRSVQLTPMESEPLKNEQLALERKTKEIFDGLESLVASNRLTSSELTILRREYANLLLATEHPSVGTRNRLRRLFAVPDVSRAMVELVDLVSAMKTNTRSQDRAIAELALSRGSVGIVSFRSTRRDGIIAAFEDVCEGPKAAPSKPKGKLPAKPKVVR